MKRKIASGILILLTSCYVQAGQYGWDNSPNGQAIDNWNRDKQFNQLQSDQQYQNQIQQRQIQDIQQQNYDLNQSLRRERILRNGGGQPNSLADELYK